MTLKVSSHVFFCNKLFWIPPVFVECWLSILWVSLLTVTPAAHAHVHSDLTPGDCHQTETRKRKTSTDQGSKRCMHRPNSDTHVHTISETSTPAAAESKCYFFSFCNALFPSKNAFNFYVVFFWQQQQVCMLMVSQVLHKILVISYKVKKEIGAQVRPPEGLCVSVLS